MSVVNDVANVPSKVVNEMGSGKFWLAALVLLTIIALVVLYVATARSYVLAKLMAHEITSGTVAATTPAGTASSPANLSVVA